MKNTQYYKCEHVLTDNGNVEYCNNMAQFITPPGFWTKRVIRVCSKCKDQIANYNKTKSKSASFTKIEYIPEEYIEEKDSVYQDVTQ